MRAKAGPLTLVVVVAVAVAALAVGRAVLRDDDPCPALAVPVVGLDGYAWDNGMTTSGSEWISVLTDGVTEADAQSRANIAEAVAADGEGYEQFRSALPGDLQPTADRLHDLALDPDAGRSDASIERDARSIARHGHRTCNLV